jgi:hypothetical protein
MDLLICDIDSVIADPTERIDTALHNFLAPFQNWKMDSATVRPSLAEMVSRATDTHWRSMFDPANVSYDTPIPGVADALAELSYAGWVTFYLSSRPESLRQATAAWLADHEIAVAYPRGIADPLMLKPKSQFDAYVKTITWKLDRVEMLARLYRPNRLLVVEDNEEIAKAIQQLKLDCTIYTALSLAEARDLYA